VTTANRDFFQPCQNRAIIVLTACIHI